MPNTQERKVSRYAMTVRLRPERREEYLRLHAAVWPRVEHAMRLQGMRNFSIFLQGDTLFGYYEHTGEDHDAAQAAVAADPASRYWWTLTEACQEPMATAAPGVLWSPMTEVWHLDDEPAVGVVDAHVHLWDPDELPYPWLDGTPLRRRFDAQDLLWTAPDLAAVVVVQADTAPDRAADEVRWVAQQFPLGNGLLGVVAFAPVEAGERLISAHLDGLHAAGPVVGIRRLLQDEPDGFTRTRDFDAGLGVLTARGLPFDVCVRARQLPEIVELVGRHPDQDFVLDHLGKPAVGDPDALAPWREQMRHLAAHPRVTVKLSGLATELVADVTLEAARPHLETALELFGPERLLFGSDWPVVTLASDHDAWRELVTDVIAGLDDVARAAILGGNAHRVYQSR